MALEKWKLIALGIIPPSFLRDEYLMVLEYFSQGISNERFVADKDIPDKLSSYLLDYDLSNVELNAVCAVAPEVVDQLVSIDLLRVSGPVILLKDAQKIGALHSLIKFIRQSIERRVRWTWYYLYQKKSPVTLEAIGELNRDVPSTKILAAFNRVAKSAADNGMILSKKDGVYTIAAIHDKTFVGKCLVDELELLSRTSSRELQDEILDALDLYPHSNKDLAIRLDTDESTISRVLKRLSRKRLVHIVAPGDYGRRYWMTNCDNCPWALEKQNCRSKSIETLKTLFREQHALSIETDDFVELDNQSLRHLVDIFQNIPYANGIERTKREVLSKLLNKVSENVGYHITSKDFEYWSIEKNDKLRTLMLPTTYLMGLNEGITVGGELVAQFFYRAMKNKVEASKLRKLMQHQLKLDSEKK